MNGLQSLLSHPAVMRLGWALIHFLWQGAAVAALLALTLLLLRRATAGARYLAACGALLLMTAAPALTYGHLAPLPGSPQRALAELPELPDIAPSGNVGISPPAADPSAAHAAIKPFPLLPPVAPRPWHARAMHWIEANLRWIVGAWFCGVLCLSIRLLIGWIGVRRIRRSGVGASETLQDRLKDLARRLSVARPVRLLTSAIADAPVVIGWLRPVILFPASLLTQLSPPQLEAILAHELAHVRRHDYLVNLFQTVVETLLFYHPAAHWVSHRVRVEREHCCDDLAVSACGDSASYARALARLAEMSIAAPRLVPAAGGQLLGRIRRLLSADVRQDGRASVWVGGAVLVTILLACVVASCASKAGGGQKAEEPAANDGGTETPPDYSPMLALTETGGELRAPTPEEIRKLGSLWPNVPPEQNATYYFAKAVKAIATDKDIPDGSSSGNKPYAGNVAAFENWVELNQAAFELMREGFKQKVCRTIFLISQKDGQPVADLAFLARVRHLARTCADAGFLAELQRRPAAAAEAYAECLQLGMALRQHGVMIQELVGIALLQIGQKNMDALVASGGLDEATLRTVIHEFREAEVRPDEPATLWATEDAYGEALMALSEEKEPHRVIVNDMWRKQRDAMSQIIEKKTLSELLQQNVAKEIAESGTKEPGAVPDGTLPAFVRVFGELGRLDVRLRVTQIRAAIALYRKANGTLPDNLDALCPDILPSVPIDPFSGKPLRYARTETGWKVWSVGADNLDHGGVSTAPIERLREELDVWQGPDYVFLSDIFSNLEVRSKIGKPQTTLPAPPPNGSAPAPTEKPKAAPLPSGPLAVRAAIEKIREHAAAPDHGGVEALIATLKDEREEVRQIAAEALGEIRDARAVEPLIAALNDPSARVQEVAVSALGMIGDKRAVAPLLPLLKSPRAGLRLKAAVALGTIGDEGAIEPLVSAVADEDLFVRSIAARSLTKLGWEPSTRNDKIRYLMAMDKWDEALAAGPSAKRTEGKANAVEAPLELGIPILLPFDVCHPGSEPINKEEQQRPGIAKFPWVEFMASEDGFKAEAHISYASYPHTRWNLQLESFNGDGRSITRSEVTFENSGTILTYPCQEETTVRFALGRLPAMKEAKKFRLGLETMWTEQGNPFQFGEKIPLSLDLGALEHSNVLRARWMKLEKVHGDVRATVHIEMLSWPKTTWRATLKLFDGSGETFSEKTLFENSGFIEENPLLSQDDIRITLIGGWTRGRNALQEASGYSLLIERTGYTSIEAAQLHPSGSAIGSEETTKSASTPAEKANGNIGDGQRF